MDRQKFRNDLSITYDAQKLNRELSSRAINKTLILFCKNYTPHSKIGVGRTKIIFYWMRTKTLSRHQNWKLCFVGENMQIVTSVSSRLLFTVPII